MVYTVSQAEALTGVPRATLRAWERRYGVIAPRRTEGGYRLYDPWQIEMLREMAARVEGGMRPAQAAASLADFRLPPPAGEAAPSGHPDLVAAAVSLNPVVLRRTIDEAFAAGPFEQVITSWLLPQLARIGEAWVAGRLTVAQEHFASAGLMTAVAAAFDEAAEDSHGPTVVVGLPPGGRHQLALLAFATCLRGLGPTVLYLGADLPVADWVIAARSQQARAAVLGAYTAADATSATEVADALTGLSVSVWVGGALGPAVRGATPLPDDIPEAARHLHRVLLGGRA